MELGGEQSGQAPRDSRAQAKAINVKVHQEMLARKRFVLEHCFG